MKDRRRRTESQAPITSRRGCSRTCFPGSRRCRASGSTDWRVGTVKACTWEVGVEKELGVSGKQQIETFGIAEFNARCRASVERHVGAFGEFTERMGLWVDLSKAYRTMDASYIESVWWSLKQIFDKQLLFEAQRVSPYCPRCETTLSDHELAQGYETVVDPSVYVRFPLTSGPLAGGAALLVWTTTPWTLVSNTAVAVNPEVDYVVATNGQSRWWLPRRCLTRCWGQAGRSSIP